MKIKQIQLFMKDIVTRTISHDIVAHSSQMAFFIILSFFPFLIFFLTLMSYVQITGDIALWNIAQYLPLEIHSLAKDIISQLLQKRSGTLLSFGVIATLWAATNAMDAMIKGIKKTYSVNETEGFLLMKSKALFYTLAISLVFLCSFVLVVFGELIAMNVAKYLGFNHNIWGIWTAFRYLVPLMTMLTVFMIVYYFIPGIRHKAIDVLPGAVFSSAGWLLIAQLFSYYVNHFTSYSATYGSLGGAIALLVWIYWCSVLILIGSEINATLFITKYGAKYLKRVPFTPKISLKIVFPKRIHRKKGYFKSRYFLLKRIRKRNQALELKHKHTDTPNNQNANGNSS